MSVLLAKKAKALPASGRVRFAASTYSIAEDSGTPLTLTVQRVNGSTGDISVPYATRDGTAIAGTHYTAASGSVSWTDGDTADKTISVTPLDDNAESGDKQLYVDLSGEYITTPSSATVTVQQKTVAAPGTFNFTQSNYSYGETAGTVNVPVERSGGTTGAVSVRATLTDGTAIRGTHYTGTTPQTLSWDDGVSGTRNVTFSTIDINTQQGDKQFTIVLSDATGGASIGQRGASTVTIIDQTVATDPTVWPTQGSISYLPIRPEIRGWGTDTTAGSGRGGTGTPTVRRVTALNGTGSGTFAAAVNAHNSGSGPSVIVFETSGRIDDGQVRVSRGDLRIAGQTAPSPGVVCSPGQFIAAASDVFVEHMRFAVGDRESGGAAYGDRDSFGAGNHLETITRCVVANCDIAWGVDESCCPYYPINRFTFWRCAFYEGLHFNWHDQGGHGCLFLYDSRQSDATLNRLSVIGCLFVNPGFLGRAPFMRDASTGVYNCVWSGSGDWPAVVVHRGNIQILNGWFSATGEEMRTGTLVKADEASVNTGGNFIRSGNAGATGSANIDSICRPPGVVMVSAENACNLILKFAGCRPRYGSTEFGGTLERIKKYVRYARDNTTRYNKAQMASYDVENMMGITRDWIERSNQAKWGSNPQVWGNDPETHPYTRVPGGFPSMAVNTSTYSDPANPNTIPATDPYTGQSNPGYTVREMYLNHLSRQVESA